MKYLSENGLAYFWKKIKASQMNVASGTIVTGSGAKVILEKAKAALIYVQEKKDANSAPYIIAFGQKQFTFAKRNIITLSQSSDKSILLNMTTNGSITVETFTASTLEYTIFYI